MATFCVDNDVKVELEYARVRTRTGQRRKEGGRVNVQHCTVHRSHYAFSAFGIVFACTRLEPIPDLSRGPLCALLHLVSLRQPSDYIVEFQYRSSDDRARSCEIHRIGQTRVNSTVLNREIASRL